MTKKNGKKGLTEAASDFAESAAKLHQQVREKESPELGKKQEKGLGELAADFREKAEELRHTEYAKAELIPMIDTFVASHLDGQIVTEPEIRQFYTDVLGKLQQQNYITPEEAANFTQPSKIVIKEETEVEQTGFMALISGGKKKIQTEKTIDGPSKFDEAIQQTLKTINDHQTLPLKLDMTEKLMFGVGKFCESLGLESISKFCMKQIKPENLEKITNREKVLASAMDSVSTIGKGNQSKSTKVEALIEKRTANRTNSGMER
jgi:hypothetical protein